ncbi:MAG: RNA polymerase sigma-70 factor, ECF subfamily, partial [bacterium]
LREPARFRSWFFAILISVHRNRSRRHFWKRFLSLEAKQEGGFDPAGADGVRDAELTRRSERAARALATLSPEQREAIVLFELEGFSIEEIAAITGSGISAVKSRLARGRTRLARCYERWEPHVAPTRSEHDVPKPAIPRSRFVVD